MERVMFLIEQTGVRLSCLLNPETLVMRRSAGLRPRRTAGGLATGADLTDDPVLFTGGGTTELLLNLLFDTDISGSSLETEDIRDLTAPLWDLAENHEAADGFRRPPLVRFLWGKAWNILGVVAAVAERLERFSSGGAPQRSFLRMRFLRVSEPARRVLATAGAFKATDAATESLWNVDIPVDDLQIHVPLQNDTAGDAGSEPGPEMLFHIAHDYYGDESWWPVIASVNGIDDPLAPLGATPLRIPKAETVCRQLELKKI